MFSPSSRLVNCGPEGIVINCHLVIGQSSPASNAFKGSDQGIEPVNPIQQLFLKVLRGNIYNNEIFFPDYEIFIGTCQAKNVTLHPQAGAP
jgi:hypothetical protein